MVVYLTVYLKRVLRCTFPHFHALVPHYREKPETLEIPKKKAAAVE